MSVKASTSCGKKVGQNYRQVEDRCVDDVFGCEEAGVVIECGLVEIALGRRAWCGSMGRAQIELVPLRGFLGWEPMPLWRKEARSVCTASSASKDEVGMAKGYAERPDEVRRNGCYHLPDEASLSRRGLVGDDPAQMRYMGSGRTVFWSTVSSSAHQNARRSLTERIERERAQKGSTQSTVGCSGRGRQHVLLTVSYASSVEDQCYYSEDNTGNTRRRGTRFGWTYMLI